MIDAVISKLRHHVCEAQKEWNPKITQTDPQILPFVTLSYAQSIDGSLAAERGKPTLLSGPASMKMTHMLRTLHDGIMVGVGTVIADNPSLNARLVEGCSPRPIIVDTHLRCPTSLKLFTLSTCQKPIILYGRGSQDPEIQIRRQALEMMGAAVLECQTMSGDAGRNYVDLHDALCVVRQNGINSVMVEGGSAILTSCLQQTTQRRFIDLVIVTIAPTFIGGLRVVSTLLPSITMPRTFPRLQQPRYYVLEEDLIILGRLAY
ncbi:unnamed protein product [Peronospora belbahrii]|uniref:Bacterial bifunctional deaminase-reductase C-terminal domain-containing protein n=1 Tax=Peronospora belbahrii TaxID=622444 RepID=A0AAU9LRR7_9STRA|nr:unnamed protein product [Peronospora belbahrii]CAH0520892.1 unnamed protein product [Peronospora belbahrii]